MIPIGEANVLSPGLRGSGWRAPLIAALVAIALVLGAAWRQGWFKPTVHLFLEVPAAGGLQVGTPVRLKGFKVGEVDEILLLPELVVRLRLKLDQSKVALLPASTSARLGREGPLSGRQIDLIVPRQPGSGRLMAEQSLRLESGSEIDDVVKTAMATLERLAAVAERTLPVLDDVHKITAEIAEGRQSLRGSIESSLAHVEASARQVRASTAALAALMGHVDADREKIVARLSEVLAKADATMASTSKVTRGLETTTPTLLGDTKVLVENARSASEDIRKLLAELRRDLPPAVKSAAATAQDAQQITGTLKRTWPLSSGLPAANADPALLDSHEALPP